MQRGEIDSLPYGAFHDGNRIGLEAPDLFYVLAVVPAVFGIVFAVSAITDPCVGWSGFVMAAALFGLAGISIWLGSGVPYWLEADRVVCRGPFKRSISWADVERFRLTKGASSVDEPHLADGIELQASASGPLPPKRLRLRLSSWVIELDVSDLLPLLEERCPAAHVIGQHPG